MTLGYCFGRLNSVLANPNPVFAIAAAKLYPVEFHVRYSLRPVHRGLNANRSQLVQRAEHELGIGVSPYQP